MLTLFNLQLTNSQEWRHGNQAFCQDVFPGEDMVFLRYVDGDMTKYTQPKVDQNVLHKTCCDDKTNQVTTVTFGNFSVASQVIRLEEMIRMLPTLSEKQYDNIITNKSLVQSRTSYRRNAPHC